MHGRDEKYMQNFSENLKERDYLEDPDIDGRILN
jgi:hypothetical protein